ncbi:MAG: amino acid adenylation domain-containing protein, partial [bacterium]
LRLGDASISAVELDAAGTKFDLTLLVTERSEDIDLTLWYRTDLFAPSYADRFLGHLRSVIDAMVANPSAHVSQLPLLTAQEREQLAAWNATTTPEGPSATLSELFERQVSRVPERAAVIAGNVTLSYAQLNAAANQLARHLQSLGVAVGEPVGLNLDRSAEALIGLIGILKAGAAYVPLPPELPATRRIQQLRESGAKVLVTVAAHVGDAPSDVTVVALDRDAAALDVKSPLNGKGIATPSSLAYVLFTSGSTGVPKGVAVTHANAVHYARAVSRVLGDVPPSKAGDGFAALDDWQFGLASTLGADLGNTSLLPSLLAGGTLHVLSKDVTTEPARFAEYVGVHALDVLKITPNHFTALVAGKQGSELNPLMPRKWIVLGGEALRSEVARTLLGAGRCRVLNHYGPTEATVGVLTFEATSASIDAASLIGAQTVPLGRPLSNTQIYIVDSSGREQAVGVPGELWIAGAGVAQGYLKRPDLTAEKFVVFNGGGADSTSPEMTTRAYRTGDRARRLSDGTIEFLGRADDQVKVRGYRVELGEVEAALRANPGVGSAVVVLRTTDGDARLIAYAVPKQEGYAVSHSDRPTPEKLTEWLTAQLPEYMVPSAVVLLDALPLTANGKVDKAKLPSPSSGEAATPTSVAPRTPTEIQLAAIWCDVLKRDSVGVTDNFLALGGHSLLAIRLLGKISKTFGVRLPLRSLFESPTVEQIAAAVDKAVAEK